VNNDRQALATGIADLREPAMPGEHFGKQFLQVRPVDGRITRFPQRKHGTGRDRRLSDTGRRRHAARGPDGRTRKITRIVLPENDMRQQAIGPLSREQGLELAPCAIEIHAGKPQRDKRGIPVPLEGIHPAIRHCVSAPVVPN